MPVIPPFYVCVCSCGLGGVLLLVFVTFFVLVLLLFLLIFLVFLIVCGGEDFGRDRVYVDIIVD